MMKTEKEPADALQCQEDISLVRGSLEGDGGAVGLLVDRLGCVPRILMSINKKMGHSLSEHDLADLSQDTLIVIWGKLGSFQGRGRLESWVYRFCFLEFMNRIRLKNRYSRVAGARLESVGDVAVAPEEIAALEYEHLEMSLAELGPPESIVIRLKHCEERTFADIGAVMNISPNSAKTCYYRGLAWLKKRLMNLHGEERP